MLPATICVFNNDISSSVSTLDRDRYMKRSMVMPTVRMARIKIGYMPQPPSVKCSIRNMVRLLVSLGRERLAFLFLIRLAAHRGFGLEQHVGDVLLHLGDVVEGALGLAVQPGEGWPAEAAG